MKKSLGDADPIGRSGGGVSHGYRTYARQAQSHMRRPCYMRCQYVEFHCLRQPWDRCTPPVISATMQLDKHSHPSLPLLHKWRHLDV